MMDRTLYVIQDQKNQKYFLGYIDNGYFRGERFFEDLNDKEVFKFKSKEKAQEICDKLQKEHNETYSRLLCKNTILDRKYEVKEITLTWAYHPVVYKTVYSYTKRENNIPFLSYKLI